MIVARAWRGVTVARAEGVEPARRWRAMTTARPSRDVTSRAGGATRHRAPVA
jgi:hypothetical protein